MLPWRPLAFGSTPRVELLFTPVLYIGRWKPKHMQWGSSWIKAMTGSLSFITPMTTLIWKRFSPRVLYEHPFCQATLKQYNRYSNKIMCRLLIIWNLDHIFFQNRPNRDKCHGSSHLHCLHGSFQDMRDHNTIFTLFSHLWLKLGKVGKLSTKFQKL